MTTDEKIKKEARCMLWIEGNQANDRTEKDYLMQEASYRLSKLAERSGGHGELVDAIEAWSCEWSWVDWRDEDFDMTSVDAAYERMMDEAAKVAGISRSK